MTWLAAGAWSGFAWLCATVSNSVPLREGKAAQPKQFDPYGVLMHEMVRPEPKLRVRISALKGAFVADDPIPKPSE